tara:strand:- start:193 stop:615 length:423 start_codon:yes stop_codon:yes gene_type:complete
MGKIEEIKKLLGMEVNESDIKEVELAESVDEVKEVKKVEEVNEVESVDIKYATQQELTAMESKFMEMFKALLEESKKDVKEVPQELSANKKEVKEEVELSEVKEIVHSPENEVERKEAVAFSKPLELMSPQERIYAMLNK